MGVKKRRGILSLLFVFLWGVFFGLGVYIVFLFLGGFSFFDSRVVQKGYASFSSNFPLYLNGEYIKNSNRYNQYEVGGYVLCVDGFEKDGVCYDSVIVGTNEEASQSLTSLFLLPENKKNMIHSLSETDDLLLFSSDNTAVSWYDESLRQVFFVESEKGEVQSFFPSFTVVSGVYNKELGQFEFFGKNGGNDVFIIKTGDYSLFSSSSLDQERYKFSSRFFSVKSSSSALFDNVEVDLKGVYASVLKNSYYMKENLFVLFFDTSVYSFSTIRDSWVFMSEKDSGDEGFCSKKEQKCYFKKNGKLVVLSL